MALTTTSLAAACGVTDTTIRVASATGIVTSQLNLRSQLIRIDDEWLAVAGPIRNVTPPMVPVRRGLEGSLVAAHGLGSPVTIGSAADFGTPPLTTVASSGMSPLRQATVTLSHAKILALPTSEGVTIVAAPGGTRALVFLLGTIVNHVQVAYTGALSPVFYFKDLTYGVHHSAADEVSIRLLGANEGFFVTFPIQVQVNTTYSVVPSSFFLASDSSIAFVVENSGSDFTGGHANNTLTITVLYGLYDMALGAFV